MVKKGGKKANEGEAVTGKRGSRGGDHQGESDNSASWYVFTWKTWLRSYVPSIGQDTRRGDNNNSSNAIMKIVTTGGHFLSIY